MHETTLETLYEAMCEPALVLAFFGWCTVINIGLLTLTTVMIILCGDFVRRVHGRMFFVADDALNTTYFKYLAYYKLGILMFNLTPYLALRLIAA